MNRRDVIFRIGYVLEHWKMGVHLALGTSHFGVNNDLWSAHSSIFGRKNIFNPKRIMLNFKMMRARCFMGFIPLEDAVRLFPDYARKHGYL